MANSEEFSQALSPLLLYLKKMKLELTCPKCSNLLNVPILLPCNHIFCSRCIKPKDSYQYDCHACPSSYAIKDLRNSAQTQAFVDIFKSMDDAVAAIVQKLGPQVDIPGMTVPSNGRSIFAGSQSELPVKDSQVDISEHGMIKEKAQQCEVDVPGPNVTVEKSQGRLFTASGLKSTSKEIPLSDCNGSDKKLQGLKMPQEETPVSSINSTKETLQEHLACREPGGKSSTKSLSMNISQNKGAEAEAKGKIKIVLLPHMDHLTCKRQHSLKSKHASSYGTSSQLVPCNVRIEMRQRLNCAHKSNQDNQLTSTSCKLPKMETKEKIMAKTSSSPIKHSASLGNSTLKQQFPDLWTASFNNCNKWRLCGSDISELQEHYASSSGAYLTKMWKNDTIHVIVSTDEQGTCRSTKKSLHGYFERAMGGKF